MDLTPEMIDRGWRRAPSEDVRRAWEALGGQWQVAFILAGFSHVFAMPSNIRFAAGVIARPVHAATLSDYCPEGWGDRPMPTEPDWWWRKDSPRPYWVSPLPDHSGLGYTTPHGEIPVIDDGQWLCPCVRPGCHEARPEFPIAAPCRLY